MKFAHRVTFTALLAVAYGAALITLVTGFSTEFPILIGATILTAAALTVVNWLWADYTRKTK